MKRVALLALIAVALVALALTFARREPSRRPSIVLVTIDTLRADRVGRGLTPHLDALAARGTSYTNVRAVVPLTLPSHVSLMTGVPPYVHGVRENGLVFDRQTPTLARTFKEAGYQTAAFVGAYVLNRRFGLDAGFDTYDDAVRRDMARAEQLEAERPAGEVVDAALNWLARTEQPFFLWVHVYDPHVPYAPPAEFLQKAGGHAYDGEVAYADAQVGRLLAALAARPDAGNTVVAVTSDHGEGLGDHGEDTHGMLAYDSTLRVPLIVAVAGGAAARDDAPRSLVDLGALLRRAAGLQPSEPAPSHVYGETRYPRRAGWHPLSVLADERWKLIVSSERELYDLRSDAGERANVAAAHPQVADAMAGALRELTAGGGKESAVAPEAAERLRALGYVSGSSSAAREDPAAPNPAREIGAWGEFERALGQLAAGGAATALPALQSLASRYPGALVFQTTYAQALQESGRAGEAVAIYRAAVATWPNDPVLFHDLAVAARAAGHADEAARAEQAALALDGTSAAALNGLGLLHADAGRHGDAAAAFDQAVKADPTNASYWTNLGNARGGMHDAAGAEAAYRQALALDGSYADALNGLGVLLIQSQRASDAVPFFERAIARDPDFHEARLNLGIAYQESGQREKAAATYRAVLATAPRTAPRERQAAAALLQQVK